MHCAGKPSQTPKTPSVAPVRPRTPPKGLQQGEGSYSGTRVYDASVKSSLETADVEKNAPNAAPDNAAGLETSKEPRKQAARTATRTGGLGQDSAD